MSLTTGLIVGVLWGAWHFLVIFWGSGTFLRSAPAGPLPARGPLLLCLPAFRVLMVWVYDRTGSLLVAMLMHASLVSQHVYPRASGDSRGAPLDL